MLFAVAALALSLSAAPAADVTGKWDGTISGTRPDGSKAEDTALLILKQKDTTITGSIGGNENDQHEITKGTIEGNKIVIVAMNQRNSREYRLELTLDGDEVKGTLSMGERRADLVAKRRKE
ncbi:MAG TPA: hypothetical protein VH740_18055 [Vicinamibacterales bacterium]|jgi:hypothetical protein